MPASYRNTARTAALLASVSAAAVTLSACKLENRPLLARDDAYRPAAAALPYQDVGYAYGLDMLGLPQAPPARIMPISNPYDGYALAERAYAYDRAAYRSPPDYGFDYYEEDPWAWQMANDSLMFAEPYGEDQYRFYYYEPGEAYPYFVRDPHYGYAYGDDGALTAMFTAAGALLSGTDMGQWANVAGAYLNRGYDMHNVYYRSPRYEVAEPLWIEQAPLLYAYQEPWIRAADTQPIWREYRVSSGQRDLMFYEPERQRRSRDAAVWQDRIDWNRGEELQRSFEERREAAWRAPRNEDRRHEAKEWRKAEREQSKAWAKHDRERSKEWAKAQREDSKERSKGHEESGREWAKAQQERARHEQERAREHARFQEERGKEARKAEREQSRQFARNEERGGGWKQEDRGGGGRGGGDGKGHEGGGGGDHGKGNGGGDKGGGDKGGGGKGGGKGKD